MIISIEDWVFDVDMTATMEYSAREAAEHCDCGYCRNFYASVGETYPQLRPFLAQFGLDIEAPEELMPFDPTLYLSCYAVEGHIVKKGSPLIMVDGVKVMPETAKDAMINCGMRAPYFVLSVGPITLPWVLDEPMEDVISPANLPSFLKRMWNRLLGRDSKGISS